MSLKNKHNDLKQACTLPDKALLFIAVIGRFEYALGKLGYGVNGPYGICIDQDKFCEDRYRDTIHGIILDRDIAPNFRTTQPLLAGVDQGHFRWLPKNRPAHPRDLIQALWDFRFELTAPSVRSNVYSPNADRLSSEALDIINVILEHDEEIAHHFYEREA